MKFQPQTLVVFFFSYFAIFFTNGPVANAYVVTSLNASTSIVPISARGYQRGPCPIASPCKGDITHYEAGLGVCGVTSDGTVDRVVALPDSLRGYVPTLAGNEPSAARLSLLNVQRLVKNDSHCCGQVYALRGIRLRPFQ